MVTGSSSGIGAAAARHFRQLGATVAVVGRSPERTAAVAAEIGTESHLADFSSLDEVRRLAEELLARCPRIDVLANNAGGLFFSRKTTADGHEMTFQVNYLAPFLLTNLLLDRLAEAPHGARVVSTVSMVYPPTRTDFRWHQRPPKVERPYDAVPHRRNRNQWTNNNQSEGNGYDPHDGGFRISTTKCVAR
jgi:NAD(P)-dependent dehydrogenase (short-subunit alcohol dehydrogenase family)